MGSPWGHRWGDWGHFPPLTLNHTFPLSDRTQNSWNQESQKIDKPLFPLTWIMCPQKNMDKIYYDCHDRGKAEYVMGWGKCLKLGLNQLSISGCILPLHKYKWLSARLGETLSPLSKRRGGYKSEGQEKGVRLLDISGYLCL